MTAGMGRPRAVERNMGSRSVLWEQMNRNPERVEHLIGSGGLPLTVTRTPSAHNG